MRCRKKRRRVPPNCARWHDRYPAPFGPENLVGPPIHRGGFVAVGNGRLAGLCRARAKAEPKAPANAASKATPQTAPQAAPKAPNAATDDAADDDQPDPEDLKLGEQLLTRDCARCHAVGRTGTSAHPGAPAFRDLSKRYPIESLEEALGEGIMSGHPDMPEFDFDADQVGAIIDYLNSIQTR